MRREIKKIKDKISPILKKNKVVKAGIFGSYALGKQTKDSDIDILIEIKGDISLLDIIGLQLKLQEVLRKKVDIIEYDEINDLLKDKILNEEVKII